MPSIIPNRFRTELARSFHRDIVNTINVPSGELNTLVTLDDLNYVYSGNYGDTTFTDQDDRGRTLSYTPGRVEVFVDGIKLSNDEYIANDGETIELVSAIGSTEKTFDIPSLVFSEEDVDTSTDEIFYTSHGLLTGDAVLFDQNNNNAIDGLCDKTRYFAIRINDNVIKLAVSYSDAIDLEPIDLNAQFSTGTDYLLTPLKTNIFSVTDITADSLDPGNHLIEIVNHDFITGDQVVYNENTGDSIVGLTDDNVYYVIRRSTNIIQLATSVSNANNGIAIDFDITGVSGDDYSLVRLNDSVLSMPKLVSTSAVNTGTNKITIEDHQFSDGDIVTYYSRGGASITGLTDGESYYILESATNDFKLSLTESGAEISLSSTGNNDQAFVLENEKIDVITIPSHDYETGQAVIYNEITGSFSGLSDGTTYYVIEIDSNTIALATSAGNATNGIRIYFSTSSTPGKLSPGSFTLTGPLSQSVSINTFTISNFPNPRDYFYVFLAKPLAWANDPTAPTPNDTRLEESNVKKNILGVKKVNPSDVCLLARRVDWETDTVYTQYDDQVDLTNEDFYVFNPDNYRVYKCLDNNNGNPSTVKPSFADPGPRKLSDNYTWQLLYEVPAADRLRFLTDDYIPVKFYGTSTRFDHNGTITELILDDRGSGYTSTPKVLILGDGTGAQASVTISNGVIASLDLLDGGSGYSFAFVYIYDGGGTGASARAILETTDLPNVINQNVASYAVAINGAIEKVEVTSSGSSYVASSTSAIIRGDGTGAALQPIVAEGQVTGIDILDRGTGYTYAEIEITGVGNGAEARAIISPMGGHGANIPQELFATTLGITVTIEDFLEDFFLDNDFRQYGLIKNIKTYDNTNLFTSATGNACFIIEVPDGAEYNLDDIVASDSGGKYAVTYIENNTIYLLPLINNTEVVFNDDTILNNETQGSSGLTVLSVIDPEISHRWGEVIYYNNISPLTREEFQTEKIKLYINF